MELTHANKLRLVLTVVVCLLVTDAGSSTGMITSSFPIPGVAKHRRSLLQGELGVQAAQWVVVTQLGCHHSAWQLLFSTIACSQCAAMPC